MDNRTIMVHFRVTPEELERIQHKMRQAGIHSMSAYLRKMAMDGYCVNMDFDDTRKILTLLSRCSSNLNQYARRANEHGDIYAADIEDLKFRLKEILDCEKKSVRLLSTLQ